MHSGEGEHVAGLHGHAFGLAGNFHVAVVGPGRVRGSFRVRAVVEKRTDLHLRGQLRHAPRVIGMVVGKDRIVDVVDAGRFGGGDDAVRVASVEIVPARVDQQRFALRIDDQRRLASFHVDEINLQQLRRADNRHKPNRNSEKNDGNQCQTAHARLP